MAQLSLADAINRLPANENRLDTFVNGDENASYQTPAGAEVPSVQNFLAQQEAKVDALGQVFDSDTGTQNISGTWFGGVKAKLSSLASAMGSSLIGFIQAGTGAVARSLLEKARETVSVRDFGAVGDGATDAAGAHQAAIDALPAKGGMIRVPSGNYLLSVAPNHGAKSIYWDIAPDVVYSGPGAATFPRMVTNPAQVAVGPYVRSQSVEASPAGGGIAALNVEMIQPAGYTGQSVAAFFGAVGSNPNPAANVWTLNPLIRVESGAGGTYQCLEIDVDVFSTEALVKGISLNGAGPANPDIALEIIRTGGSRWDRGIDINQSTVGMRIRADGLSRGVVIGDPLAFGNSLISGKQLVNGSDALIFQRNTDTAPGGFFARGVNAANTETLWSIDYAGNLFGAGGTFKSDQPTGFTGLVAENASVAAVTTKTVGVKFRGRDTVGTLKDSAEIVVAPTNSNLTGSTYTLRTRAADALVDRWQIDSAGNGVLMTLGGGLRVKEGTNAKQGTATLVGGAATVTNTSVTANSRILLTSQADGGTPGFLRVSARVAGTSFTITSSSAADTSTVAYEIFEPA